MSLKRLNAIAKSNLRSDRKLQKMIQEHIDNIVQNSNEHATMLKELRSLSVVNQLKIIKLKDQYEALFRGVILECIKNNLFRDLNYKLSTFAILGMMNWLIYWYSPEGEFNADDIGRILSDVIINGLKITAVRDTSS